MKKLLTLTIFALIALFAIPTMVQAGEVKTTEEFKTALETEEIITLTDNMTLTENVKISDGKTKVLNLNGKTLTQGDNYIIVENGTLTVKNGNVVSNGDAFEVLSKGNAILNIEKDVNVTAGECAVYIKFPGAVLNTEGNLKSTGAYATIQGNGLIESGGIIVNITGGTITSESEAIYFPNTAELNISGGKITGQTAVYQKSGKLNISGGTLNAIGDKAEYVYNSNGCNTTGDALVIEASDYPGGVPEVKITGGVFTSKNNKSIGYYQQAEKYKISNEKFITGGEFSNDISEYVPAGYVVNNISEGTYNVEMNTPSVTNEPVDSSDGKVEIEVVPEFQEDLQAILEQEVEENAELKGALLAGKSVNIDVQLTKIEEEKINKEELKAIESEIKDEKLVNFYDIAIVINVDGEEIDTITNVSKKLKFKVHIPNELVKENRTFFMYRYHKGKVEKITGEVDKENYLTFETDKFSTYVLAYEDKVIEEKDDTPKTGSIDVVLYASAIIATISLAGIVLVKKYTK